MKKLMFALAAMAAGVAMADGIASANVVGYQTITRGDNQNFCNGSMFVNVSKSVYTLDDIKITVASPANDRNNYIVFMAAGSSMKVNKDRAYWWDSANSKWRVRNGKTKTADGTVEDPSKIEINPGEGFLCNFMQANTTIQYSGEVIQGDSAKKLVIARPEGIQNFVACNTAGREISLSELTMSVASPANDRNNYIVFMAAGSSMKVDKDRAYWWDSANSKWRIRNGKTKTADGTVSDATAVKIAAGEGFLCNFMQSTTTLTLPSAL